ncbi:MAG: VCBS repeat-containing protein [Candidatus Schekmanbacteria bacterium]|nr:VCBS repeat-containing protein [Candidatus Schekmanbacteria bacterium]
MTRGAELGDFTGDGNLDLAHLTGALDVLPGNGDGTFETAIPALREVPGAGAGEYYSTLRAADFDQDGKLDVVFLGTDGVQGGAAPRHIIAYGAGGGTFGSSPTVLANQASFAGKNVVTGDFNKDVRPDLAIWVELASTARIEVYTSDGASRSFTAQPSLDISTPASGKGLLAADLTKDGNLDLVAPAVTSGVTDIMLARGNGDGTFQAPAVIAPFPLTAGVSEDFVSADLNGDGNPDLVGIGGNPETSVYVLLGTGGGSFGAPLELASGTAQTGLAHVLSGDLNGDGKVDLVTMHSGANRNNYTALVNDAGPRADLGLSVAGGTDPVAVGDRITYAVTVKNADPDSAAGVVLSDAWGGDGRFWAARPTQGSCSGSGPLSCALGELASGAEAAVTVELTNALAVGPHWDMAAAKSAVVDPNGADNGAAGSTGARTAGVRIDGPRIVLVGETPSYVLHYANIGGAKLTSAVLLFQLAPTLDYVANTGGGIYYGDRNQVFWKLGDLEPDALGEVSLQASVPWGIPPHTAQGVAAALGWSGSPAGSPFDVSSYLSYVARTVTARTTLTTSEVDALLAGDTQANALFAHAKAQGYQYYDVATRTTGSDGSQRTSLWLINPAKHSPAAVTITSGGEVTESVSILEGFGASTYTLADAGGSMAFDTERNWFSGATGSWAKANSPSLGQCMTGCLAEKAPMRLLGQIVRTVATANTGFDCWGCY